MKHLTWIILLFGALSARGLDTVYLIRHAEKETAWPQDRELSSMTPLTAEGLARAERWAEHLKDAGIVAVYGSPTTRSLHTGLPVSQRLEVPLQADVRTVQSDNAAAFLAEMKSTHADAEAILIVGHSNTVPYFLEAAEVPEECLAELGVSEHSYGPGIDGNDGLWTVQLSAEGCARASVRRIP